MYFTNNELHKDINLNGYTINNLTNLNPSLEAIREKLKYISGTAKVASGINDFRIEVLVGHVKFSNPKKSGYLPP